LELLEMGIEDQRHLAFHSPLGQDVLLVQRISGSEGLATCFEYVLDLYSLDANIKAENLLGQHASVRVQYGTQPARMLDGIVCEFQSIGSSGRYVTYRAVLRPWLWLLSRNRECRVFQQKTTLDIVREVFQRAEFSDLELQLMNELTPREYCVQYRESDLAFVSRLLEDEGIYYFFRHELGRHVLVLADSMGAHSSVANYETLHFKRSKIEDTQKVDASVYSWISTKRVLAGKVDLRDYDFTKPRASLESKSANPKSHEFAEAEIYDAPGNYTESSLGDKRARTRLEETQAGYELSDGSTDATGLFAGALFTLADHPRSAENREYLITSFRFDASSGSFESGHQSASHFAAQLVAMDSKITYRPPRRAHWPLIAGAQTAVVVGPKNNEIWTDEYGRVKVQFHWDRYGKADESSSCWIRVAQVWAGNGWGSLHVPRIGHEVVVEFLEGNPDQPLITGSVYNGGNAPPYMTHDQHTGTRSGIKSKSTKGGGPDDYNELRFDDDKGREKLALRAQRDLSTQVNHDSSTSIGNDHTHNVKGNIRVEVAEGGQFTKVAKGAIMNLVPEGAFEISAKQIIQTADESITLQVKDASISIDATSITLKVGEATVLKLAFADLLVKGPQVNINPPGG
jgi:type VI secretion system secreted protein VgrG